MSPRILLILCCVSVPLSLAASPPPATPEIYRKTVLPKVEIKNDSAEGVVHDIANLCHASKDRIGDVNMVLINDPRMKPKPFSFSGKDVQLSDLMHTFCEHYGWSYIYAGQTLVMGTKDGLDRFLNVYEKKRWPLEKSVIIRELYLISATVGETGQFLNKKAQELDPEGKWEIRSAGDTAMTATLYGENIPLGEVIQLFSAAVGREPEQALPCTRMISAGENNGPDVAIPAIAEVNTVTCTYWRAFDAAIEITITRQADGRLSLMSRLWPAEGKPVQKKSVLGKIIGPEQMGPILELVNATAMRNAFAAEGLDDRLDGSLVELTVVQRAFGVRFASQDVFGPHPAVKDVRLRHAVEALFKLAELEFKDGELY